MPNQSKIYPALTTTLYNLTNQIVLMSFSVQNAVDPSDLRLEIVGYVVVENIVVDLPRLTFEAALELSQSATTVFC